jgi:hypothetical protein
MGLKHDQAFSTKNPHRYLLGNVQNACRLIYERRRGVLSKGDNDLLKSSSTVPTRVSKTLLFLHTFSLINASQNAFVDRLGPDFDIHSQLVIDLMYEFELGVWKSLFTHLIRILYA